MKKMEPLYIACRNTKWRNFCEKVWWFLKRLNVELSSHDPAIALLGVCP